MPPPSIIQLPIVSRRCHATGSAGSRIPESQSRVIAYGSAGREQVDVWIYTSSAWQKIATLKPSTGFAVLGPYEKFQTAHLTGSAVDVLVPIEFLAGQPSAAVVAVTSGGGQFVPFNQPGQPPTDVAPGQDASFSGDTVVSINNNCTPSCANGTAVAAPDT